MKTSVAVALVAGASAQMLAANPYVAAAPVPYWAAAPYAAVNPYAAVAPSYAYAAYNQQAVFENVKAGVNTVTNAISDARKAQINAQARQYEWLSTRDTNQANKDRYLRYSRGYDFQIADTDAEKAHKAFTANPNRATSLASEAANYNANRAQYQLLNLGADEEQWGPAGRFHYQSLGASLELAEDGLKAAERGMAFNNDAAAYYNALEAYNLAENNLWEQTFRLQGDNAAGDLLERQRAFGAINKAYDTYRGNPNQWNTEDFGVARTDFANHWFDKVRGNDQTADLLASRSAQASARNAAKRAQAAGADFAVGYGNVMGAGYAYRG